QFIQQGLLLQDMDYGSLKLTEQGEAVLNGAAFLGQPPARPVATPVLSAYDMQLFEILRRQRKALADEQNVPPYIILSDRTLAEMATYYPHSREAFAALHGVGESKLARYADLFLPLVAAYCTENNLQEKRKVAVKAAPSQRGNRRQEVVEHFRAGMGPDEIRALYDVKLGTVVEHLWQALQEGEALPGRALSHLSELSPAQQETILALFAEMGSERLRPVYLALNSQVPYEELHLLRLHYALAALPAD
ncbi:MAG: HRDC domain-containing protein, partial [Anaerolineales bacterium]|nr:HRDC domain-containing protein [Anaerolineales bacterium]